MRVVTHRRNLAAGVSIEIDTYDIPALLVSDGVVSAAVDLDEATIAWLVQALATLSRPARREPLPFRVLRGRG